VLAVSGFEGQDLVSDTGVVFVGAANERGGGACARGGRAQGR